MHKKATAEKNEKQKIKLILNVITPDIYEKKFKELREFMFQDLKGRDECEKDKIEYDSNLKLTDESINNEILLTIVENIFRKA